MTRARLGYFVIAKVSLLVLKGDGDGSSMLQAVTVTWNYFVVPILELKILKLKRFGVTIWLVGCGGVCSSTWQRKRPDDVSWWKAITRGMVVGCITMSCDTFSRIAFWCLVEGSLFLHP